MVTLSRCFSWLAIASLPVLFGCTTQASANLDHGDLILSYEAPSDQNFNKVYSALQESEFFDDLVAELNDTYVFPQDIDVVFDECGEDNAEIEQFDVDAEEDETLSELPFWGAHSLSIQRVYNIACLAYGSDPQSYADFVEDDFLPEERAEGCPEEYELAAAGWETLLVDFTK